MPTAPLVERRRTYIQVTALPLRPHSFPGGSMKWKMHRLEVRNLGSDSPFPLIVTPLS